VSIIVNIDPKKASFELEQFPALVYKNRGVSFLLFSSGSCVITILKDFWHMDRIIEQFKEKIL
jgi:TATA-box binding protein (TBP) (component of TFIID and TFIIIB)